MDLAAIRDFLGGCTLANYAVLLVWFAAFTLAHNRLHRLHAHGFALSRERFDAVHYAGMAVYKIGILLFNLVPFVVLTLMR
jgi:hypothetical protein